VKILKLSFIELLRRPKKNLVIASSIVMSVALLTSLSIVSDSANLSIMKIIANTGHTLTVRPAAKSTGFSTEENRREHELTMSEIVLGSYIPETAIPEIMKYYEQAIKEGWEKKGGLVSSPGIPDEATEPATWAPRLFEKVEIGGQEVIVAGIDLHKEYFVRFWWNLASGEWPIDIDYRDVNTNISTLYTIDSDGLVRIVRAEYERDASGKIIASVNGTDRTAPVVPLLDGWDEAYLGGVYAGAKGIRIGDKFTIGDSEFTVRGILENTNSADDYMVFIPITTAQRIFNRDGHISLMSVRAMCPNCPVGDAMVELNKHVTGITAVSQLDIAEVQFTFFNMLHKFLLAVVVSTIIVGMFSVFNIVTGSLYGRTREIGMLKAVGASRSQLFRIFIYEHFILGLAAGICGFMLGVGMAYLLSTLLDTTATMVVTIDFLWRALFLGIICSLLAIIYPAYSLSRLKITETFRTQWEN
jgi:putative ABC transport system permease protein